MALQRKQIAVANADGPFVELDVFDTLPIAFLGEPMAACVTQNEDGLWQHTPGADTPLHIFINVFVFDLAAPKILAGDEELCASLLAEHYQFGLDTQSYELSNVNRFSITPIDPINRDQRQLLDIAGKYDLDALLVQHYCDMLNDN